MEITGGGGNLAWRLPPSIKIEGADYMMIQQLKAVCEKRDINIFGYGEIQTSKPDFLNEIKGIAIKAKDLSMILYDDKLPLDEQVTVISHEIAHHVMGHLSDKKDTSRQEAESQANDFSTAFMAMRIFNEAREVVSNG